MYEGWRVTKTSIVGIRGTVRLSIEYLFHQVDSDTFVSGLLDDIGGSSTSREGNKRVCIGYHSSIAARPRGTAVGAPIGKVEAVSP